MVGMEEEREVEQPVTKKIGVISSSDDYSSQ